MPYFSESGHDLVLCQVCGRDIDTGKETPTWRPDITGNPSAGNVCRECVAAHEDESFQPPGGADISLATRKAKAKNYALRKIR
jgi:hypothetical protein